MTSFTIIKGAHPQAGVKKIKMNCLCNKKTLEKDQGLKEKSHSSSFYFAVSHSHTNKHISEHMNLWSFL